MRNPSSPPPGARLLALLGLLLCTLLARADTVYVTTYGSGGVTSSTLTPCNPDAGVASVCDNPLGLTGVSISTFGSTAVANPPGAPAHTKCIFGYAGTVNWSVQPQSLLAAGGTYAIYVAHSNNGTTNALITAFSPDGTMSASCTNSDVFQKSKSGNTWYLMGYITNNPGITQPTVTFYLSGGYIDNNTSGPGGAQRLYIDCFQFVAADPCLGVAGNVSVVGPLVAGGASVSVSGVTAGATNVTVFDLYYGEIGETNSAGGFAAGTVAVPTITLLDGDSITAQQTVNGCVGNLSSAKYVGSGPNPTLQVALGLGKLSGLSGPIGASAASSGSPLYWVHADGRRTQGFAVAPTGGYVITPSTNWVTLTFNSDTDPVYDWSDNVYPYTNHDDYAVLYGLALAIDDVNPDIGPYRIYIDSIYNGTNLIQGFEASAFGTGYSNGTYGVMFLRPGAAGTPAGVLESQPDTNYVNNAGGVNADTGTNSLLVSWAFKDTSINNWVNLYSGGTGTQYPQVDLHQPVTIRLLVLPVGESVGRRFDGSVSFMTNSLPGFYTGGSNTLGVSVTGTGAYTYQWSFNGSDIPGATDPAYTLEPLSGLTGADAGLYTVSVTDEGGGTIVRSLNAQVSDPAPTITNQLPLVTIVHQGSALALDIGVDGHVEAGYPLYYQWLKNGAFLPSPTGQQLSVGSASTADVGSYSVIVTNNYGAVTSRVAYVDVVAPSVVIGTGDGLRGDYYTLHTNNAPFTGSPTLSRVDSLVDFNFGNGSPDPSISSDYFTARWYGQIQALDGDTYTIGTYADDGSRLWVNGQNLVNNWVLQGANFKTGTITLAAGQKYDLVMEYFENGVTAQAQLWWSNSTTVAWEPVPTSQLYSLPGFSAPTVTLAPADGSTVGGSFTLTATVVTNTAAEITSVQFFTNGVLLASAPSAPPYSYTWAGAPSGTYLLSAQVQYDKSTLVNSDTNSVTVQSTAPVSSFSIAPGGGGSLTLSYSGGAGARFVLLQTNNPAAPVSTWPRVKTNTTSPGSFTITPGADPAEFYRIKSE